MASPRRDADSPPRSPSASPRHVPPGAPGERGPDGPPAMVRDRSKISGAPSSIKAFRLKWRELCQANGPPVQLPATRLHGATGAIFVRGLGSIPFVALP